MYIRKIELECGIILKRQWEILLACEQAFHFRKYRERFKIIYIVKVKNDHRSKVSNLSNWKGEA